LADETVTFSISSPGKFFNVICAIRTAGFAQAKQSRILHGGPAAQNARSYQPVRRSPAGSAKAQWPPPARLAA
jgi:hypothetical protein